MSKSLQPYLSLVKNNVDFRRLWLSQAVSNFGDWFGLLALYAIVARYSESEFLIGLIIVVKMLSLASFSPLAGYITDRFNRKNLMIGCDYLRAAAILGILFVRSPEMLWLAYVLTAVQMMLSAVFEPAKTSSIPNVTKPNELVNANIISTATWSIIFTTGMALGGFATEWIGTDWVLIIDGATYVLSAWFIARANIPQKELTDEEKVKARNPFKGIQDGFRHILHNKQILRPNIAKGTSTLFLGGLVYLLIIVSEEILMMGSIGLGLLYAARGFGTGIGPVIGRRLFPREKDWVMVMGGCIVFAGVMYMVVGWSENLWIMVLFVLLAHSASGANWVMSTVLLQKRTIDSYRGRIFSTEWLLFTVGNSISVIIASLILEFDILNVKRLILVYGSGMALAGVIWSVTVSRDEKKYQDDITERRNKNRKKERDLQSAS